MSTSLSGKIACAILSASLIITPTAFAAKQPLVSAEEVFALDASDRAAQLARVQTALEREDVVAALEKLGVSPVDAQRRVEKLNDAELVRLAHDIENAPAGGIIDAIIFVFLVLLLTDILGFTKVFPFTRSIRR